ncbi:MAG: phosphoglycerate kinase [Porticoccaceae bacterium]|jgi:phosphoglycerate kinase|nr:phosphoglycerate kinase [Porticoccaceae bacterium]
MTYKKMSDLDLTGKSVLIREDFNVPVEEGVITSDARLRAALPSLELALQKGAGRLLMMSHLGRPTEGQFEEQFSLAPVARYLTDALGEEVQLVSDLDSEIGSGRLFLLENVRFNPGEKSDDEGLSQRYADLCDIFVMDAFGTAHRAQASTHGVALRAKQACAGPLLDAELSALSKVLANPEPPMLAIVGGSKVSTKLTVLEALSDKVDQLIVGGGIANTFVAAMGYSVGKSLHEADLVSTAKALMEKCEIPMPVDLVVAEDFSADAPPRICAIDGVAENEMILDIGPESSQLMSELIHKAGTLLWNGPVGVFEFDAFAGGTEAISRAISDSPAYSVAGGGDTLAAIDKFGISSGVSYISTGGGAFLEYVEGKELPAVTALKAAAQK